jgi:phospholipid transport system substrate-binding protein
MNAFLRSLFLFCLMLCGAVFAQTATNAPSAPNVPEAPDALIRRVSSEVMDIARTDKAIQSGDRRRIYEVVESKVLPHLDFQRGTALTMGRYWRQATPEQRQRVSEEFRNLLLYTYAGAMSQIRDQTLEFKPARIDPADTDVEVHSEVRLPRRPEPVQVSYRLHKSPAGWKIYDVNVMGAWLSETYKATFSSEISKGGVDGLIRTLEEKNRQLASRDNAQNNRQ